MNIKLLALTLLMLPAAVFAQLPAIDPGVSQDLAKWRSARYSDIRYKLDLTLEKMSPVLKGHMEIRVTLAEPKLQPTPTPVTQPDDPPPPPPMKQRPFSSWDTPIILDWRKLPGHEKDSTVSNLTLNGLPLFDGDQQVVGVRPSPAFKYHETNDHLILPDGIKEGENVITLDFTSPILTSGSAITRYIDKEDGSEYIYSLFVPSDASTAFPVFDQPDLKAKFTLNLRTPAKWTVVSNTKEDANSAGNHAPFVGAPEIFRFEETKPISTYVFAFAAGPFAVFSQQHPGNKELPALPDKPDELEKALQNAVDENLRNSINVYVRKSQAAKFQFHAAETFRLTREAVKYLETYFDYKFPWPKYDLVLIPEFPFGGMEHAGATFLRESSVIFPTEPTRGDEISRANVIFHETAHQWFGDLVTMRWFDDLWLKEGFAEFMAYKTLEHVMPDANAWKVFYERNKQAAYATDSTRGTTPIYQKIDNLSAAKSAYGNIVYRKAPSFLRQAEFYLGEDKFQTAVRAFLKKHAFANAGWEDLVGEFEMASGQKLQDWGKDWVTQPSLPVIRTCS